METNTQDDVALKALGSRIRNLRNVQGLSQAQLADSAGMSARYLGEVEAGKRNVSFGRLNALAKRLSVPLAELLNFEEPQAKAVVLKELNSYLEGFSCPYPFRINAFQSLELHKPIWRHGASALRIRYAGLANIEEFSQFDLCFASSDFKNSVKGWKHKDSPGFSF